jgi:predicted nucleotidyltransferase
MSPILEENRHGVAELCRRYGVVKLDVFGSAARADFDPNSSDIDFIVQFRDTRQAGYANRYLRFAEELEELLRRRVDLITERSLRNPVFIRSIAGDRQQMYAA